MIRKRIEEISTKILTDLGITAIPIPIKIIAEKLGLSIETFEFGKDVSGALFIKNGKGIIGINPKESDLRQRFTIAHELGHYILHGNLSESFFIDKSFKVHFRDHQSSTGESLREQEANAFAASILMPKEILEEKISEQNIDLFDELALKNFSKLFKVSSIAMTYRISNLNLYISNH